MRLRSLFTLLLFGALCAVTVLPDEHRAHRTVENAVEAAAEPAWRVGKELVQAARETLSDRRRREGGDRHKQDHRHHSPTAGRAALNDRLTARVDQRADRIVRKTPGWVERSVDVLAAYLGRRAGPTRRGRTRAAFRWVADHVAYDTGLTKPERMVRDTQSPAAVLRTREAVCEGYAKLFVALAERMGLEVAYIIGDSDPVGPGGGGRHAWNAVKLADGWYYLDPTWAAGHVTQGRFVSEFDEEWWLTSPQKFNHTHHPDKERWVLEASLANR